jgi:hypothetical protein
MTDHVADRKRLLDALREELVGPEPRGEQLDTSGPLQFGDWGAAMKPHRDSTTGEEIIKRDTPCRRYGVGILYPKGVVMQAKADDATPLDRPEAEKGSTSAKDGERQAALEEVTELTADSEEYELALANEFQPSSMGVSFLVEVVPSTLLHVVVTGGRYHPFDVDVAGTPRKWWLRVPVRLEARFDIGPPSGTARKCQPLDPTNKMGTDGKLEIGFEVISRPATGAPSDSRLVTVSMVNRSKVVEPHDTCCLFQAELSVSSENGPARIRPYPAKLDSVESEEEDAQAELLFRGAKTFAVGHGCAADWSDPVDDRVDRVVTCSLPAHETPSMTNDVSDERGPIKVSMLELAGGGAEGLASLRRLTDAYVRWIDGTDSRVKETPN